MKIYATVTQTFPIEVPDYWDEGDTDALEVADYHFNDKLDEDEALKELGRWRKPYIREPQKIDISFSKEEPR